ncbi:hypothetical protein MNV49_005154 [Pseudohyphozyma bogoriensis]|nr:hypothetical protein MNV49_005154 [Pseudohyphozyma bogoriensis]
MDPPPPTSNTATGPVPTGSFEADPRVHFNTVSSKWTFEADDGSEMEWDTNRGAWVPVLEDSLVSAQQAAYSVAGVDESAPVAGVVAREAKKRKADASDASLTKKSKPTKSTQTRNTAIFITRLPPSTTTSQLASVFSKAGLILEDAEGNQRVKLYRNDEGRFTGQALIVYLKEDSVELAVRLMDETELVLGSGEGNMRVEKADWEKLPKDSEWEKKKEEGGSGKGEDKNKKQRTAKRAEKLLQKLTDWDSDEESSADIAARARNAKIVVLEGMFTLKELEEDPALLLDLKEDVREECETLGEVTNVTLYDQEADGIMTVRFKDDLAAQACISKMNGRFFAGRSISAYTADGKKYKRGHNAGDALAGTGLAGDPGAGEDEKEKQRLEEYAKWLERDEEAKE